MELEVIAIGLYAFELHESIEVLSTLENATIKITLLRIIVSPSLYSLNNVRFIK
jgi:hypothetical protein